MHLFYSTNIQDNRIELGNEESKHLAKVLRLDSGEKVAVIDGKGSHYNCTIELAHQKSSVLTIDETIEKKELFGVNIAAAPTKNLNRWEWFLEKATEIGIDSIHPILTYHSERKVIKRDRQERILVSAMKQSYKATLPGLSDLTAFKKFITQDFQGKKYIAHCYDEIPREQLKKLHQKGEKALILIGPEGDFSKEEVNLALENGFTTVSLSQSRLRTETAALIACHTLNMINA